MTVVLVQKTFVGDITFENIGLWLVPTTIRNDQEGIQHTYNLLLDTGAERTVITPLVKEYLSLVEVEQNSTTGVMTSGISRYSTVVVNLEIASIPLSDKSILVGSLPGILSTYKIDGLLGADILRQLSLKIDYPESLLTIRRIITTAF